MFSKGPKQEEQKGESAYSIRTGKGHFVILVLCFVSLHKYCYSTAPIQGPGKLLSTCSPIGTDKLIK
ncbi:hypothetical protein AMECASPLE_007732 [Ameca splendens]|uniref:Uncharacterized protein n=1 Tax=Ameca splendens TaxID=208324 RepID=A0ABV0YAU5_9TELE